MNAINFWEALSANRFGTAGPKKFIFVFFLANLFLIGFTCQAPLGDFGNYYYGSKFFFSGIDPFSLYGNIHYFNSLIRSHEQGIFFENYTPVPPLSLLAYIPFLIVSCAKAKLLFNSFSLLVLCLSLHRAIKHTAYFNYLFYLLPLVFLQPLYSNFLQGQAYLIVTALLLELFMSWQNGKAFWPGLIIGLLFGLKVFPAFMVILFVFNRNWKALAWSFFFSLFFVALAFVFVGKATVMQYYTGILPRLAANEITNPFLYTNQSIHAFLMNSFIYDAHRNPFPFFSSLAIAVGLQLFVYVIIFTALAGLSLQTNKFAVFFCVILALAIINKYSTVYGLLMLLPFIFVVKDRPLKKFLPAFFLLFLACNIPVQRLSAAPLALQYTRAWLLLVLFLMMVTWLKSRWRWQPALLALLVFVFPSLGFDKYSANATLEIYPSKGILYDFSIKGDQLSLYTCSGSSDAVETMALPTQSAAPATAHDFKKMLQLDPIRALIMTDRKDGVGMYHLEMINLKDLHD